MAISKKILKYLEDKKYKFSIISHKTTYTAWDTAQTEKIDPKTVAKSLVMKADKDYFVALVPGNKNLDKQKLLKVINAKNKKEKIKACKKIDFAKEAWMKENLVGKVGATPPFQGLLKLPVFVDSLLFKNKKIYLGSGEYTESILLNVSEYVKKEEIIKGSFSKLRKY